MMHHRCESLPDECSVWYSMHDAQWYYSVSEEGAAMHSCIDTPIHYCPQCGWKLNADGTEAKHRHGSYMPFNIGATVDVRRTATVEVAETGQSVRIDPGCYELLMREVPQWGQEGGEE